MSASALAQSTALPVIVFMKQHDSHLFADRTIICNGEIKVGRAVAKLRPSNDNAIFDCKVLSRSHAIIYYDGKKFILRDTNSSNGTFVNNIRITSEQDNANLAEREIFSNDFIKFGVEVAENGTNHGCIITQIKLYHPNGGEALPPSHFDPTIENHFNEQLFQLASHVSESTFRERTIQKKIDNLKSLMDETREMSKKSWVAMLNEERLLDKLELYENQLKILKSDLPEDSYHSKIANLLEEKSLFEQNSKRILEQRLEEKMKALIRVTELENCLSDSEREAKRLRESLEASQDAYTTVANNLEHKLKELDNLDKKLCETSDQKIDLASKLQSTTEKYQALVEQVDTTSKLYDEENCLKENEASKKELEERAYCEIAELDRYIDMQDELSNNEKSLEKVLESTNIKISANLVAGARQLSESRHFINLLQDEINKMHCKIPSLLTRENTSEEGEVSSSGALTHNHCDFARNDAPHTNLESNHGEAFGPTVEKIKKLATMISEAHTKTEHSLISYFDDFSINPDLLNLENREDADGGSDKATDANEPVSTSLKDKLKELTVCSANTKMSASQMFDYQRRMGNTDEDGFIMDTSVPSYSMMSSAYSALSSDLSEERGSPVDTEAVRVVRASPLSAPIAAEDDVDEEDLENGLEMIPRKDYVLVKRMLEATKQDLSVLQEALRHQKEENAEYRQLVEKLQLNAQANGEHRHEGDGTNGLEDLRRDYERMREKMDRIEQELALTKTDYLSKVEESRQLRKELQVIEASRDELRKNFDTSSVRTSGPSIEFSDVPSDLQRSSPEPPTQSGNLVSSLTAVAAVSVMILLLAVMLSIFSQFSK